MDLSKAIKKLNKISTLVEKLDEKQKEIQDDLLDWVYSERKQVLDYHNTGHYCDQFAERDCDYHTLSAHLRTDCIALRSKAQYGDRDSEYLEIPLNHLFHPELVADLISRREALFASAQAEAALVQEANEKKLLADLKAKYEAKP